MQVHCLFAMVKQGFLGVVIVYAPHVNTARCVHHELESVTLLSSVLHCIHWHASM